MLIKVKNKDTISLPALVRLALKYVYERKEMSSREEYLMKEGIVAWHKHVLITESERELLQRIAWFLDRSDKGHFDKRVEAFQRHKIDYKRFHRLPEVAGRGGYAF
jgi:hypothetical protein